MNESKEDKKLKEDLNQFHREELRRIEDKEKRIVKKLSYNQIEKIKQIIIIARDYAFPIMDKYMRKDITALERRVSQLENMEFIFMKRKRKKERVLK